MRYRLLFLITLLCFCACGTGIKNELDVIERQMAHSPDSALVQLEKISLGQLHSQGGKARYALLKSMALDKNYIDVTDDSLINVAVNYYSGSRRQPKYKMLAYYYYGIIQKNSGDYPAAIISFEKAGALALEQKNWRYLGLIYRNTGGIFNMTNNDVASLEYYRKAVEAFTLNKDSLFVDYANYSLAVDLMECGQYEESRSILRGLFSNKDEHLKSVSFLCYAQTCVELEDSVNKAIQLYRETPLKVYNFLDYGYRSQAHLLAGQLDSAEYWMNKGFTIAQTPEERATLDFAQANIDMAANRPAQAFSRTKRAAFVQDSLTRVLLNQSLSIAQRDYYMHEVSLQNTKLKRQRITMVLIAMVAILLAIVAYLFIKDAQRKREGALKDAITRLEMENKSSGKNVTALIGTLFLEKYAHLDIHALSSLKQDGTYSIQSFKKELVSLGSNDGAFNDLYDMLDRNANCIIAKLRSQVTFFNGYNLKMIALFFAIVPDEIIQYILRSQSVGSLKTCRSRFRAQIKGKGCPDEQLFLSYLDRQPRKNKK